MIKCYLEDKTLLVEILSRELDHHIARDVREEVDEILLKRQVNYIIFDFKLGFKEFFLCAQFVHVYVKHIYLNVLISVSFGGGILNLFDTDIFSPSSKPMTYAPFLCSSTVLCTISCKQQ